jgi:serine/threonine protein kinase/tetratricopeptide (TPR) repeat protein
VAIHCPKCQFDNTSDSKFCKKCGTQLLLVGEPSVTRTIETPVETFTRGTTFAGRYEIIEKLGKGGMGNVYRVEDRETKEEIALKLIKPEIASDKKTIDRFRNELTTARKIRHKNICGMYDLGEHEGTYYITMEYVSGEDLQSLIKRVSRLDSGTAIKITKQVCEGLEEAHRLGVIHRDLKPSNIMIDKEGNARIMDFGIARAIKAKGITGPGVMIGTPEYMSPEQVEGKETDQRSDIYSLGVILYEMVIGRVPFEGDTPFSIGVKHKSEIPKDPKELNTQIPEDLCHVILRCLEKDKDKRHQSAFELKSDLTNIEKSIPTTEREVYEKKSLTSKQITVQYSVKKVFISALVLVAIVIIGLVIWRPWSQKKAVTTQLDNPSIAVLPFTDLSPQKDQESFCDGMTDEIIAKLSRLKGWKVMNRTSVMRYKNTEKDPKEIGQELNVATILEGSIRQEKDDIRINAQLINVKDGFYLWSDTYGQKLDRIFVIQNNIAEKIANALQEKLTPEQKERLLKNPTENLEAYTWYLKGRLLWGKRDKESLEKSIEYYRLAIKEDPNYTLAYTGIADTYSILVSNVFMPSNEGYPKAKEAALKALELDATLAEAHTSIAIIKENFEWDWKGAEKEYIRAIELNPNYATAHHWYALNLLIRGLFDRSISEMKIAQELDPYSLRINRNVGMMLYFARRYDESIEALKKTIEMDPDKMAGRNYLGLVYLEKSEYVEALAEFEKMNNQFYICMTYGHRKFSMN